MIAPDGSTGHFSRCTGTTSVCARTSSGRLLPFPFRRAPQCLHGSGSAQRSEWECPPLSAPFGDDQPPLSRCPEGCWYPCESAFGSDREFQLFVLRNRREQPAPSLEKN